jgi:hypothetical protein
MMPVLQESVVSLTGQLPYGEDPLDRKDEGEGEFFMKNKVVCYSKYETSKLLKT